jgi:ferredoxin-NADP reductase
VSFQESILERIEQLTPRISSFYFRSPLAPHLAGQHVDVQLTAPDGYLAQRSYSIASAPGAPLLELAIERLDEGEVSSFFHSGVQVGDAIELRGPLGGHFVWRENPAPLLLVGGGSGIAPLIAIARHRVARSPRTPCLIVYSAQTWDDLAYRDELLASNATVRLVTTRGPKQRDSDYERRLDRALLAELLAHWQETPESSYVCGSTPFVETVTRALVELGLPPGSVRAERYGGVIPS